MSKPRRPRKPDDAPPVMKPPPVAEAATDVQIDQPEIRHYISEEDQVYRPVEPIVCEPVTMSRPAELRLPEDLTPPVQVERADRISAGKLIARKLGIPPASAQLMAGGLPDVTILGVLAVQLEPDAAARIREILGY